MNQPHKITEFKLKVFHTAAVRGNFSRAAEDLFISQPAVTKQINSLEKDFGLKLFERGVKGIVLTTAGRILFEHSSLILAQYERLNNDLSLLSGELTGELIIGASTTIAQYVLPPLLARFYKANPSLKITLINGNSEMIESLLLNNQIHLGITEGLPNNNSLKYGLFIKDQLLAVTHKGSRYSPVESCSLEEMKRIGLVLREQGSGTLEVFEDYLKRNGRSLKDFNVLLQLGSSESIKLFLKNSDALGIISVQAVKEDLLSGEFKVIRIEEGGIFRNFYFVHTKDSPDRLVRKLIHFLNDAITKGSAI